MSMKGVELAARYALMPNRSGYCGTTAFEKIFMGYLDRKTSLYDLKKGLEMFPVHYSYLKLIAEASGKEPFDDAVVEAFWLGNKLLEKVDGPGLKDFVSRVLVECGLDKKRAENLSDRLPKGILPHHSFNSLYVKFVTGKVKPSISNMDKCRIGWGRIKRVGDTRLSISYPKLAYKGKSLAFKDCTVDVVYKIGDLKTIDEPRIGDWVSTHWGLAVQKLTHKQLENLKKYTVMNLAALNRQTTF